MDPATVRFGLAASDYATHRQGFPPALYDRLAGWGMGRPHQRVLDLATGTGTLARGLARKGCNVTGLDHDAAMVDAARALDAVESLRVEYVVAPAEAPPFDAGVFDIVTAGQCWHWFDGSLVAGECRRVLKPGGWLVTAHYDWIPLHGNVPWHTERLIEQHNPAWKLGGGDGFHLRNLTDLGEAGFMELETFSFDVAAEYTHEAWRGRIRASAGVGASLTPEGVAAFDAEHAAVLREHFPEDPFLVLHRVFVALGRTPA